MNRSLTLDFYETPEGDRWCWKYGVWSSEEYPSEQAALGALSEKKLVFSQPDRYAPYDAALIGAKVNLDLEPPFDLWLIAGSFYCEPGVDSVQLGEVGRFIPPNGGPHSADNTKPVRRNDDGVLR